MDRFSKSSGEGHEDSGNRKRERSSGDEERGRSTDNNKRMRSHSPEGSESSANSDQGTQRRPLDLIRSSHSPEGSERRPLDEARSSHSPEGSERHPLDPVRQRSEERQPQETGRSQEQIRNDAETLRDEGLNIQERIIDPLFTRSREIENTYDPLRGQLNSLVSEFHLQEEMSVEERGIFNNRLGNYERGRLRFNNTANRFNQDMNTLENTLGDYNHRAQEHMLPLREDESNQQHEVDVFTEDDLPPHVPLLPSIHEKLEEHFG